MNMLTHLKSEAVTARNCAKGYAKLYQETHNEAYRVVGRLSQELKRDCDRMIRQAERG